MSALSIKEKEQIKEALDRGETIYSISRRLGYSESTISRVKNDSSYRNYSGYTYMSDMEIETIKEALERGESMTAIARRTNRSLSTIGRIKKSLKQAEQKPAAKSSTLPKTATASTLTKDFVSTAWQKPLCETQPVVIIQYLKHLGYYGELHIEQVIELKKPNQ